MHLPCELLKDRPVVPRRMLAKLMTAMLQMKKIDLAALNQAFAD